MAISFRILDQDPVYFDDQGIPVANGYLSFFQAGTTTPQSVYEDPALTINNGPVIALGPDGRATLETWGSGSYRVRLYASDNTLIWDRDNVQVPGSGGLTIPTPVANDFLTNDGTNLLWQPIEQVPDVTGNSGKILGTDGVNPIWQSIASLNIPAASVAAGNANIGGLRIQWGTGAAPLTNARQTATGITFPVAFSSTPVVLVNSTTVTATAGNQIGVPAIIGVSPSSFTVQFDSDDFGQVNASFIAPNTFCWVAFGLA